MLPPQFFSAQAVLSFASAYMFSGVTKRALIAAPAVGSAFLFADADVSRQLSDIQSSSSLRSQQPLVLVLASSLPLVLLLGGIRLATVAVILVLRLMARAVVASTLVLLALL